MCWPSQNTELSAITRVCNLPCIMKIDFSEYFKNTNRGFCGSKNRIVLKTKSIFQIDFAKFPAEYLGYSGYGVCGVHTEKIIMSAQKSTWSCTQTRAMHVS